MSIANMTSAQLRRASSIQEKIEALQSELASLLGGSAPARRGRPPKNAVSAASAPAPTRRKHKMSAAGRARIAAAQKARWAKVNAAKAKAK